MALDKLGGNSFSTGAIANSLGYTPLNKAGDSLTGALTSNSTISATSITLSSNVTANDIYHTGWRASMDRGWGGYPSISVYNDSALGSQSEFRIHGLPGPSGGDFSINLRVDGMVYAGSYSLGSAGYTVLNNGVIVQWGSQSVGPDREVDYSFPTTFPSGCYGFSASGDWHGTNGWMCVGGRPISSSVYRLYNIVETTKSVWWIAIGY